MNTRHAVVNRKHPSLCDLFKPAFVELMQEAVVLVQMLVQIPSDRMEVYNTKMMRSRSHIVQRVL